MVRTRPGRWKLNRLISRLVPTLLLPLAAVPAMPDDAVNPLELWERIREARLDTAGAVRIEAQEIDLEFGNLLLDEGFLVPAAPLAGRAYEFVFAGRGRIRIEPPDGVEASQIELFTGDPVLDASVSQAVLVAGNEEQAREWLDGSPPHRLSQQEREDATALYLRWIEGAERRGLRTDAAIFKSALDDAAFRSYLGVWCISAELGEFHVIIDPADTEQVTVGQFVAADLDDVEQYRVGRRLRRERRRGRFSGLRLGDLGNWDTWLSASRRSPSGESFPGTSGFEPELYTLDLDIVAWELKATGRARLDLRCEAMGRRVTTLELFPDLRVRAVRDGDGRELPWVRSTWGLHVVLPRAMNLGDRLTLEVDYDGVILDRWEKGILLLRDTVFWHPHTGDVDRAHYDVTIRWPTGLRLVGSGTPVEGGKESGKRWERRTLTVPSRTFTFEVGDFHVLTDRIGHVDLTVAVSKATGSLDTKVKEELLETLKDALAFFEETFGAYPLDRLEVATIPRDTSQGHLGFITLSHELVWTPSRRIRLLGPAGRKRQRTEYLAHEISHQWWGNKLGFYKYRDQWLVEALAEYSEVLFTARRADFRLGYIAGRGIGRKLAMADRTKGDRTLESLGPVVLGTRLHSSKSEHAHRAVVYDKGSVVFGTLARIIGEEPFLAMLKALATAVNNRAIDTDGFIKSVERMSGRDLGAFAAQFVYGTGIPAYEYEYEFVAGADGGWDVVIDLRRIPTLAYRYRLFRTEAGTWDVSRSGQAKSTTGDFPLVVPFHIEVKTEPASRLGDGEPEGIAAGVAYGWSGEFLLEKESDRFTIHIDEEPKEVLLDRLGEIMARFFCESQHPKQTLRRRAERAAAGGHFDTAQELFAQALRAKYGHEEESGADSEEEDKRWYDHREQIQCHLGLARLQLDRGFDDLARAELDATEQILKSLDRWDRWLLKGSSLIVESRLDIRSGDYKRAYQRLSRELRLDFPMLDSDTIADAARRQRFKRGSRMGGDAYALLAVAAYETDHRAVALRAMEEAEERGADITELRELLSANP